MAAKTVTDLLLRAANAHPHGCAFAFMERPPLVSATLSYLELLRDVERVARAVAHRTNIGDRVVIMSTPSLEFISEFLGVVMAGCVAVPLAAPLRGRGGAECRRLREVTRDCEPVLGFATGVEHDSLDVPFPFLSSPSVVDLPYDLESRVITRSESIAVLQYTSGSTGNPKGVCVTHANILANQELMQVGFCSSGEHSIGVGWIPMAHDLGLMGNVLHALWARFPMYLMSPMSFLQRPLAWLEAISVHHATFSGAPTFAFDLCTRRAQTQDVATLDLRSWEVAFVGAEPIYADTLQRFVNTFERQGFSKTAFFPAYGQAECTLAISGVRKCDEPVIRKFEVPSLEVGEKVCPDANGRSLVGVGGQYVAHEIVIASPDDLRLVPAGTVGEILVSGPSVAAGYFRRTLESDDPFRVRVRDTPTDRTFLRTRDLGFFFEGELFVLGRSDDVVITFGRNIFPADVEHVAEQCPGVRPASSVFFQHTKADGASSSVLLIECDDVASTREADETSVRNALARECGVYPDVVLFTPRGTLLRTTNGKKRRRATARHCAGLLGGEPALEARS